MTHSRSRRVFDSSSLALPLVMFNRILRNVPPSFSRCSLPSSSSVMLFGMAIFFYPVATIFSFFCAKDDGPSFLLCSYFISSFYFQITSGFFSFEVDSLFAALLLFSTCFRMSQTSSNFISLVYEIRFGWGVRPASLTFTQVYLPMYIPNMASLIFAISSIISLNSCTSNLNTISSSFSLLFLEAPYLSQTQSISFFSKSNLVLIDFSTMGQSSFSSQCMAMMTPRMTSSYSSLQQRMMDGKDELVFSKQVSKLITFQIYSVRRWGEFNDFSRLICDDCSFSKYVAQGIITMEISSYYLPFTSVLASTDYLRTMMGVSIFCVVSVMARGRSRLLLLDIVLASLSMGLSLDRLKRYLIQFPAFSMENPLLPRLFWKLSQRVRSRAIRALSFSVMRSSNSTLSCFTFSWMAMLRRMSILRVSSELLLLLSRAVNIYLNCPLFRLTQTRVCTYFLTSGQDMSVNQGPVSPISLNSSQDWSSPNIRFMVLRIGNKSNQKLNNIN